MSNYVSLSAAIKAKIQTSTTIDSAYVYDYAISKPGGYPAVTIVPSEMQAHFADTGRNERHWFFDVKVYQERIRAGEDAAERILRQTVDELITLFDADMTLGGACAFCRPIPARWAFVQAPDVDTRVASIMLECVAIQ